MRSRGTARTPTWRMRSAKVRAPPRRSAGSWRTMAELAKVVRDASGRPPPAPLLEGVWH